MVLILPDNSISFVVCEEHTNTKRKFVQLNRFITNLSLDQEIHTKTWRYRQKGGKLWAALFPRQLWGWIQTSPQNGFTKEKIWR